MIEDLEIRKNLSIQEIESLKKEFSKNEEFIRLFIDKNQNIINQINNHYEQIKQINKQKLKIIQNERDYSIA